MTGTVLERSLRNVIARLQKLRVLRSQTACWLLLLVPAIAVTLWLPATMGYTGPELPVLFGATIIGTILSRLLTKKPSVNDAARLVEQTHPELNDAVLTAVQISQRPGKRPSVLAAMAVQEADQLARQRDWSHAVSGGKLAKWTLLSFLSFVVMVSSVMAASRYGRDLIKPTQSAGVTSQKKNAAPSTELVIEPGDVEIERGSALTVVAKFPAVVPTNAVLEFVDSEQNKRQLVMNETVDAGVFATRMEEIGIDGKYRVIYYDADTHNEQPEKSAEFNVTTYVRPELEQVDAVVTPPAWTSRAQETIEDVMRMTVTEGSTVQLKLRLNKPVAIATLQPKDGPAIVLTPNAEDPSLVEATLVVMDSHAWIVQLLDTEGRTPKDEEQISIKVSRNQRPKIKVTFPGKDTNVSPLQEFLVEAMASDDFGITAFGMEYSLSGGELKELALNQTSSGAPSETIAPLLSTTISHEIILEDLKAAPDDLLTYTFWASDIGPDGLERRSYSDILFAEVRRFEEIFRESQQQQSQQQQQQQQNQQQQQQGSAVDGVLKLQKEIISATWNTIRAEAEKRKNGSFTMDVSVISESQNQAIVQLEESMEGVTEEPKLAALGERAMEEMTAAYEKLEDVKAGNESARLAAAMSIEQSIVQTLLKMRAAEFEVQQQQQGSGGGGGSASQQQLQQLELDNKRNRYETEQQAQQQQEQEQEQTQQQREQVQVLNRLKELARRQQMVNERLKQLESELRAATTEKEKEEIERQLKRLRDEQREMLRDVDELSERMEQAANPQQQQQPQSAQKKQEMQQQMEQARENVQQAARAMDAGNLAEAISQGTRAEREFEELKEDFRNQTSSQFDEAVRDLRDQARELSDQQEKLAQKLAGNDPDDDQTKQPSLRPDRNREQLQKDVAEQRDRLNQVVDQTKQMIEQAEETEPLLSNKLYDTLRDLKDAKPDEALQATELLTSRGMWSQSQQAEQAARKGIEQLKEGIEKAADSVLGSEVESLRRAQSQLQDATEKLESEVQNASGEQGGVSPLPVQNEQPGQQPSEGKQPGEGLGQQGGRQNGGSTQQSSSLRNGGREGNNPRGGANTAGPLTGSNEFTEWSDQLRDIEEMLDDPELRNRVAQVRDRAKAMRAEFKRHGEQPQWDLVKSQLLGEMQSLQQRIAEELAKRDSDRAMVPIDREPVPEEFDSLVQKYYELLGRERDTQ